MGRINAVVNLPSQGRLPKIGNIRLGTWDGKGQPREAGHFIFDIGDPAFVQKALAMYGPTPKFLDIAFFSNTEAFIWSLQQWGKRNGKAHLLCEGRDGEAVSDGRKKSCPCPLLESGICRMTARMKFIIPTISSYGYFLCITKSKHSVEQIDTVLTIAQRTARTLIMRPFRLVREEGYATLNKGKVRKYYISLQDATSLALPAKPAPMIEIKSTDAVAEMTSIGDIIPASLLSVAEDPDAEYREQKRIDKGRQMVKDRLAMLLSVSPYADYAIENYAKQRFRKDSFNALTRKELLELWHDLKDNFEVRDEIVNSIERIEKESSAGV